MRPPTSDNPGRLLECCNGRFRKGRERPTPARIEFTPRSKPGRLTVTRLL